eukprot:s3646_g9.t1
MEIRGHTQHPWNELVDSLAKWALLNGTTTHDADLTTLHSFASAAHDVGWSWMQTTHPSMAACFPPLVEQQILQIEPSPLTLEIVPNEQRAKQDAQSHQIQWTLHAKTANVLATEVWSQQAVGTKRTGQRTLRLDQQWHTAQTHVIGVQEARTAPGKYQSTHYHILASGAKISRAPLYGCELWIHRTLPIAWDPNGKPITLGDAVLTVQHADPRRLFVQAQLEQVTFTFIVLHTPCLGSPQQNQPPPIQILTEWWDDTSALMIKLLPTSFAWVFIDANSPLDAGDETLFGSLGAEALTKQGELFKSFLQKHELVVPSTFSTIHEGPTTTWTHSTGNKSRKDYVLLSQSMLPTADKSWVDVDHDTTFAHEDHLPVALVCKGWSAFAQPKEALSAAVFCQEACPCKTHTIMPDTLRAIQFKRHILDFGRKTGAIAYPCFKHELKEVEREVHRLVRRDVQTFYAALLGQLEQAGEMSNHRLVYRILQRLGRKKGGKPPGPRPLPVLKREDGTAATNYAEQQAIWLKQFATIEAGLETTWEELQRRNEVSPTLRTKDFDPATYPTSWMIQELIAKMQRDKVPGPNLIPPGVMKAGGEILSRHLSILFTKAASHAKEPLLWKGGTLVPLWKGKASPELPTAYRSIFISNYTTKLYHQCVRKHLIALWENGLGHMQYGGRAGMGADIAHHVVQCHQEWAKSKACPSAVLFVDIRSAFYTVLRQTFTTLPNDNSAFFAAMTRLGLSIEEVTRLVRAAESDAVTAGLSMQMQHILHDLMSNTYFSLPGIDSICQTTRGTRPGDPIADVLFNLCMTAVLKDFHELVREAGGPEWLGSGRPVKDFSVKTEVNAEGYADVTFVDDAALIMHAKTNDQIVSIVQCLVQCFVSATHKRGLEVNFDRSKTELLWNIVGRGARTMKVDIHQQQDQLIWTTDQQQYRLHICHEYKHLGTWIQTKHRHARELSMRASAAKQQWGQLARPFFTRKLSSDLKAKVFQSLVISKMLYNAHTWTGIAAKEMDSWTNALRAPVATMVKSKLAFTTKFQHTTDELFAFCQMLPLQEQVYANRLRFLARLLRVCPPLTWALLCSTPGSGSWVQLCLDACRWMQTHCADPLPSAQASFDEWIQFVRLDDRWKGRIRKTVRSALAYHHAKATQAIWQRHFEARLHRHGATLPEEQVAKPKAQLWQCELCPKVFGSSQALAMHAHRDHGYKKKVRYYAAGETCPVCLQFFHTRKRLSIHLEKGPRCYSVVQACWPPMPAAEVQALDDIDKVAESQLRKNGWWAAKAFQPVIQAQGPSLPPLNHPEGQVMFNRVQCRRPSDTQTFDQLQGRQVQAVQDGESQVWWTKSDLPAFIMHSVQGTDKGGGAYSMSGLAKEAAILHVRALVIVHFFSGFRRDGDIHSIIDHQVAETGANIFTISVDLCMQRQHANLATDSSMRWWASRVAAGQIVSAGGDPLAKHILQPDSMRLKEDPAPVRFDQLKNLVGCPSSREENGCRYGLEIPCSDFCLISWRSLQHVV